MLEEEFVNWLAEQRMNSLSGKENIFNEEAIIKEITKIFGDGMDLDVKTELALFIDRLIQGEKAIYEKGMEDGIRLAKWVFSISK